MITKYIFNLFGSGSTAAAIYMNIQEWLFQMNVNQVLTYIISLLAIIYWIMKIIGQYKKTKN